MQGDEERSCIHVVMQGRQSSRPEDHVCGFAGRKKGGRWVPRPKQLTQAGSLRCPGVGRPGGTAWRTLCLWQPSVMAEIPGEQQDSSLSEALEATDDDIYVHLPRSPQRVVPGQSKAMCL